MYLNGEGVTQSHTKAKTWLLEAAKQGFAEAQNNLGVMYCNDEGVPQDYPKAEEWFRKSAEQGNPPAEFNLGLMYKNGDGVPQNDKEAAEWCEKAAMQGHPEALTLLSEMHANGLVLRASYPLPQRVAQTILLYIKKVIVQDSTSLPTLALKFIQIILSRYVEGRGNPSSNENAYVFADIAAAKGHKLGKIYRDTIRKDMTNSELAKAQNKSRKILRKISLSNKSPPGFKL